MATMSSCLSFSRARDHFFSLSFLAAGLRPHLTTLPPSTGVGDLSESTQVHVWAPRNPSPSRPKLLLIHGFGASATWQWNPHLRPLLRAGFDVYVPDLLFFGQSHSCSPLRSVSFQADCIVSALSQLGVTRLRGLVGVSYGGFVGYEIAAKYPELVERIVMCCAGVCLEEEDLDKGLFVVRDCSEAAEILLPQTPDKLRQLVGLSFVRPPPSVPDCFLSDYIQVMCTEWLEEKTELIHDLIKDRKIANLPKLTQPTLIIWGEQDQIFPLELGHRLKRHLGENSQLVVIKNAGHAVNLEKVKELCRHTKAFLLDPTDKGYFKQKVTRWKSVAKAFGLSFKKFASTRPLLSPEKI